MTPNKTAVISMPPAVKSAQSDAAGVEDLFGNTAILDHSASEEYDSSTSEDQIAAETSPTPLSDAQGVSSQLGVSRELVEASSTRLEPNPVHPTTVTTKKAESVQSRGDHEVLVKYAIYGFAVDHFTLAPRRSRLLAPFGQPKPFNLEARLAWEKELRFAPLTSKLSGEQIQIGLQAFRNISGFMGNRASGKGQIDHCFKLLRNVMPRAAAIKDEIFCQLCKQLTGNPEVNAVLNGWLLFSACLVCFPPSPILAPYLERFFAGHVGSADDEVAKFAATCLASLHEWTTKGKTERQEIPSLVEIQSLRDHTTVSIVVLLIDGISLSFGVSSWTTTGELSETVAQRLGVAKMQAFALFEISATGDERRVDSSERVVDVLALWERVGVEKQPKKKKSSKAERKTDATQNSASDMIHHLVYKVFLHVPLDDDMVSDLELVYKQAVHDITAGIVMSPLQECIQLAAYQLYVTHGPFSSTHGHLDTLRDLASCVPARLISSANRDEIGARVQQAYAALSSGEGDNRVSPQQVRLAYLKVCGTLRLYGSTFFAVHNTRNRTMPPDLILAVNHKGIAIVSVANDAVLHQFPYVSIATWGYSSNAFVFVVSVQGIETDEVEYVFKTKTGKAVNDVVAAYIAFILTTSSMNAG